MKPLNIMNYFIPTYLNLTSIVNRNLVGGFLRKDDYPSSFKPITRWRQVKFSKCDSLLFMSALLEPDNTRHFITREL